jgi:hypothetical protein
MPEERVLTITLSGPPKCGKTSVAHLLLYLFKITKVDVELTTLLEEELNNKHKSYVLPPGLKVRLIETGTTRTPTENKPQQYRLDPEVASAILRDYARDFRLLPEMVAEACWNSLAVKFDLQRQWRTIRADVGVNVTVAGINKDEEFCFSCERLGWRIFCS